MRLFTKKMICLSVLLVLAVSTTFAQDTAQSVVPGSKGALPDAPKLSQLAAGQFAGLEVTFVNGDYTNLSWPNISKFGGATACTLMYRVSPDGDWMEYIRMDALQEDANYNRVYTMSASKNFDEDDNAYDFKIVLHGGEMDEFESNIVTAKRCSMSTVCGGSSSDGNQFVFVGLKLGDSFYLSVTTYTEEGTNEYTSEDGYYTYQWYRRNPNTFELTEIKGATNKAYTPVLEDFGYEIIQGIGGDEEHCSFLLYNNYGVVEIPVQASFEKFYVDGYILNTDYDIDPNYLIMIDKWSYGEENKTGKSLNAKRLKAGQYEVRMSKGEYESSVLNLTAPGYTLTAVYDAQWMDEPWYREVQVMSYRSAGELVVKPQVEGENIPATIDVIGKNMDGDYVVVDTYTFEEENENGENGEEGVVEAGTDTGGKTRLARTRGVNLEGNYIACFSLPEGAYYVKARKTDTAMETYYPSTLLYSEAEAVQVEAYEEEKMHQQPNVDVNGDGNIDENDYQEYQPAICIIDMKPAPAPLEGSGVIEGSVTRMDENKTRAWAATEDCRIYLQQKGGAVVAQTTADENGGFQFKNVPFGDYQLLLDITCCNLASIQGVTLTEAAPTVAALDYVVDGDDIILKSAMGEMLALQVTDDEEAVITNKVSITWYNADQEQIAKGGNLRGLEEGTKVYYSIVLDENLGRQYREVLMQETTFENGSITCQLEKIGKVTLMGRVSAMDIETNPAKVQIVQKLNGKYEESFTTATEGNGVFSIEIFDDVTDLTVSRADCSDATVHRERFDENGDLGIIPLSLLSGVYLTVDVTYQPAVKTGVTSEDQAILGGLSNFDISIKNGSTDITDFVVLNSNILIKSGAAVGDNLTLTLKNKQGLYADAIGTFEVKDGTNNILLDTKELGGIYATGSSKNASDVGYVYDANGALAARAIYTGEELNILHLPSGDYTLVSMKNSQVLGNVQSLASLNNIGLKASDYVSTSVTVADGAIATVSVGTIPSFDESAIVRITDNTYFNVNKTSTAVGEYLTFTSYIELKDVFAGAVNNISLVVDVPAGCTFMKNSAMVGRNTAKYNESGNRVTISLTKNNYQDKIRFCVMPDNESDYTMTAYVAMDDILQPIGATQFVAKGFPISAPKRTATSKITVSGKAPAAGTINVYDNDVLIGSTSAYWQGAEWSAECELDKPYDNSFHSVYAKVKTGDTELSSETKIVEYDKNMIAPVSTTMLYYNREFDNTYNIKFDYKNGATSHSYYYFYPFKYDDFWNRDEKEDKAFTFVADFTQNDPDKIKNIFFKVLATDGTIRTLPGTFDSKKNAWVATTKYWSSKLPVNVSLDYDMLVSSGNNHEDGLLDQAKNIVNMSNQIYQYLQKNASATKTAEDEKSFSFTFNLAGVNTPFYGSMEELDYSTVENLMKAKQFSYAETDKGTFGSYAEWNNLGISTVFADLKQKYAVKLSLTVSNTQTRADISQEELNTYIGSLAKKFSNTGFVEGIGAYANALITVVGASEYFGVRKDFDNMLSIIENYSSNYNQVRADLSSSMNTKKADGTKRLDNAMITQLNTEMSAIAKDERAFIYKYYQYMEAYQQKLLANVITDVATSVFGLVLNKIDGLANFQSSKANEILQNYQAVGSSPSKTVDVLSYGLGLVLNDVIAETSKIVEYKDFNVKRDYVLKWSSDQNLSILERYAELKERIRQALKGANDLYDEAYNDNSIFFQAPSTEPILDPSGYVYEGVLSNRLSGVTTTVYYKNGSEAVKWDAENYGQKNPLVTDANGFYQWNVPQGEWQVKYEKEGYETVTSEWLPVPPPQLDVNQAMKSATAPEVTKMKGYEEGIIIEMSKHMLVSTLTTANITVTRNGAAEKGKIELADPEAEMQSEGKLVAKVKFVPENNFLASDEVKVTVHKAVQSYCEVAMADDYTATVPIEGEVKKIDVDEEMTIYYQDSKPMTIAITPKEASKGKKLNIKTSSVDIVSLNKNQVDIDENGKASFLMTGELLGEAYVTFEVEGTDVKETTKVIVVEGVQATESIKISAAKQVAYCSSQDLDFSTMDDLKAYVATGYDKTTGTIWLTRVKDVPANTGFLLMGEAGEYPVPVKEGGSNAYYKNMFKGTLEAMMLPMTEKIDGKECTNYYLSSGDKGVGFYKVTKAEGQSLGANRAYLPIPTEIPAVGTADGTETIKVSGAGQVPYYSANSLDFTDMPEVKAYTATGYDYDKGTIWLTRVKKVPAETGILIMAAKGDYPVPTASVASIYENMFKGSLTASTIPMTESDAAGVEYINYYLSSGDYGVGFYKVTKADGQSLGANRCYLPIPKQSAGTRGIDDNPANFKIQESDEVIGLRIFGSAEGTTGINATLNDDGEMMNDNVWYNLQGQRVENPGKGLYIRNGKKVLIK